MAYKIFIDGKEGTTGLKIFERFENRKDIEEINERYLQGVNFHFVENVMDVLAFALLEEKAPFSFKLTIPEEEKEESNA